MASAASFSTALDEVASLDECLLDSPRVKELLTNLEKLRSLEASQLESFFTVLRSKVSFMIKVAAVYRLMKFYTLCTAGRSDDGSRRIQECNHLGRKM